MFTPSEIIFSATDSCNLHCSHCFVSRTPHKLKVDDAISLLHSCKGTSIEKIGFSGGEPFLYVDFICQVSKAAVEMDYLFDQIMTNGDWWQTEDDLKSTLQKVYDSGYDGKFGLSYDTFHNQPKERMQIFINTVNSIFGENSVNVQSVIQNNGVKSENLGNINAQYFLSQIYPSENPKAWQSKKWFKDDFCEGPGNILYVHPNGKIAPCCGFANENDALIIGNITDSFETIMQNANTNKMVQICFKTGLGKYRKTVKKQLRKQGKKLPGKCGDICTFCDYVCKKEGYF